MKLHHYARSSASYRVRIGLNLKGLAFESVPVNLLENEHLVPEFKRVNPQALVPALEVSREVLSQSLAILEYLEEQHPDPPLLPKSSLERARVRSLALAVACEIHPLQNLGALNALDEVFEVGDEGRRRWARRVIDVGLRRFEDAVRIDRPEGAFCHGDRPTLADVCLIPQLFNARRFECDLGDRTALLSIEAACLAREPFQRAAPGRG